VIALHLHVHFDPVLASYRYGKTNNVKPEEGVINEAMIVMNRVAQFIIKTGWN
jgi:hypothetical protein